MDPDWEDILQGQRIPIEPKKHNTRSTKQRNFVYLLPSKEDKDLKFEKPYKLKPVQDTILTRSFKDYTKDPKFEKSRDFRHQAYTAWGNTKLWDRQPNGTVYYYRIGPTAKQLKNNAEDKGMKEVHTDWWISNKPMRGFGRKPQGVRIYGVRARLQSGYKRVWKLWRARGGIKGYTLASEDNNIPDTIRENMIKPGNTNPNWTKVAAGEERDTANLES